MWLLLGAALPSESLAQAAASRVVYRAAERSAFDRMHADADQWSIDAADARSGFLLDYERRKIDWRGAWGQRSAELPKGSVARLAPRGYVSSFLVVEGLPALPSPSQPDIRRFALLGAGLPILLSTGIDTAVNVRLLDARFVRTFGRDTTAEPWAALYQYAERGFEGDRIRLRVRTYDPKGDRVRTIDGVAFSKPLRDVVMVDPTRGWLVTVAGSVWDIARGAEIGALRNTDDAWWVEASGAFFRITVDSQPKAWGIVETPSEKIIAGGERGRTLTLQRLRPDTGFGTVPQVAARIVAPVDGEYSYELTSMLLRAFRQQWRQGNDANVTSTPTVGFGDGTYREEWSFAPGPTGFVEVSGKVILRKPFGAVLLDFVIAPGQIDRPVPLTQLLTSFNSYAPPAVLIAPDPGQAVGSTAFRTVGLTTNRSTRWRFVIDAKSGTVTRWVP